MMMVNRLSCVCPAALRVTKPLKDVVVPETKVATFECEVSHFGVQSVWLKDGQQVEMSEKFNVVATGKVHQLKVMDCCQDDSGEYVFVCGDDRVSAKLTVDRKLRPSFLLLLTHLHGGCEDRK